MVLHIRPAELKDASEMAHVLNDIIAIGNTTAHRKPFDEQRIITEFVSPKRGISCFVATDRSSLLGIQALEWSDPNWSGDGALPADWAIIATYVAPGAHRKGVGRQLFAKTAAAAKQAGVCFIDATIRKENTGGRVFYEGIGFVDYRSSPESVSKRFTPS